MNVYVFSQQNIEKYGQETHYNPSILISITAHCDYPAKVMPTSENNIKDILFLTFDDTDDKTGITEQDATQIKEFLKKNENIYPFYDILVNCNAGQSRSAGVAAAILMYYNHDDSDIFDSPRFTPNMKCYRTVLNKLFEDV